MASRSRGPSASRQNGYETSSGGASSRPPTSSTQKAKSASKADRILGVADPSQLALPRQYAASPALRKAPKKGFASAFADLKAGALSVTTRYGSRGRRTPSSPGFRTNDSESISSMTSPTFDTSASTSTLPSYHEPPVSPHFSRRGSDSPSSPRETDGRWDYHATLSPGKYKGITDMPSISEQFDTPEDNIYELPPLEKPILSVASKPSTPKTMSSFSPINRLRSPSTMSVASEATTKARLFSRRSSKRYTKEIYLDYPSTPSTEHHILETQPPIPRLPATRQEPSAVEQWLARADLERHPSLSSTFTGSTFQKHAHPPQSANSSQLSVKTLTTTKDFAATTGRQRRDQLPAVRSEDTLGKSARKGGFRKNNPPNLIMTSMLSLSSSDEDSDQDHDDTGKTSERNVVFDSTETTPKKSQRALSFASSSTTAPQFLQMQREVILSQSQPKRRNRQKRLQAPSTKQDSSSIPFSAVAWQGGDESELGAMCAAATERAIGAGEIWNAPSAYKETRRKVESVLLSPTSRVMVVSKKEERLLAQMREKHSQGTEISGNKSPTTDDGDETTSSPVSFAAPIISISPSRPMAANGRSRATESGSSFGFNESAVINFPAPPSSSPARGGKPGERRHRTHSLSLSLSRETLNQMTSLPEVANTDDGDSAPAIPPLPTGDLLSNGGGLLSDSGSLFSSMGLLSKDCLPSRERLAFPSGVLSPDAASNVSPNYSVSDLTASVSHSQHQPLSYFNFTSSHEVGLTRLPELPKSFEMDGSLGSAGPSSLAGRSRLHESTRWQESVELQGSMPEPGSALALGRRQKNRTKSRASSTMVYVTGLEGPGKSSAGDGLEDEDEDEDEDLTKYVMASVL